MNFRNRIEFGKLLLVLQCGVLLPKILAGVLSCNLMLILFEFYLTKREKEMNNIRCILMLDQHYSVTKWFI